MPHSDDELPEDHAELIRLAGHVPVTMTPMAPVDGPAPARIAIDDDATALVDGPLVGFSTHGR